MILRGRRFADVLLHQNFVNLLYNKVELEDETEYGIAIDGTDAGTMKTNLGGKLSVSVELGEHPVTVSIRKCR